MLGNIDDGLNKDLAFGEDSEKKVITQSRAALVRHDYKFILAIASSNVTEYLIEYSFFNDCPFLSPHITVHQDHYGRKNTDASNLPLPYLLHSLSFSSTISFPLRL